MCGGHAVESSHRFADTAKHRFGLIIGGCFVVEHIDQRTTAEVFDDELAAFVIKVPNGRHGKAGFSGSNQQAGFADHASHPEAVVQIGVAPGTRPSLLSYRWATEPLTPPNLGLCTEVKALCWLEGHGTPHQGLLFERSCPSVPSKRVERWGW